MRAADRQALNVWLSQLADGDRDAFAPFYAAAWPAVRALTGRMLRDDVLADDAAQQAMVDVFARIEAFDPSRDALAWTLGVATWRCRTLLRSQGRRREEALDDHSAAYQGDSPETMAAAAEERQALRDVLATLAPDDAATLLASVQPHLRDPELAPATFRKRVQRAMNRLRAAWRLRHDP
jgi:RNA polymerase sigma-70 factor (ECF subfamily)